MSEIRIANIGLGVASVAAILCLIATILNAIAGDWLWVVWLGALTAYNTYTIKVWYGRRKESLRAFDVYDQWVVDREKNWPANG